jgi:hypothetical protein
MSDLIDQIREHLARKRPARLFPPADQFAVARAEASLGLRIPELLKRIYTEIANGGFGPGYGVLGVEGGFAGDYGDLVGTYRQLVTASESTGRVWQKDLLPFCAWGCAILSCVTCGSSLQVATFDSGSVWPQEYALEKFFEMWLEGVDILRADPNVYEAEVAMKNPFTRKPWKTKTLRRREK